MAISPKCAQAINQAAGRDLTEAQLRDIEGRIRRTAQQLARADLAQWRTLTPDQRTLAAAKQAMADMRGEAAKKLERAQLQILKTAETEDRITTLMRVHKEGRNKAVVRDLRHTENMVHSEHRQAMSELLSLIDAAKSGEGASAGRRVAMWLFDVQNPKMSLDMAREIYGQANGATGNKLAQQAARVYLDMAENARTRFNAGGGDVGKLDYGYLPQPHDQVRILKAGQTAWVEKNLNRFDRNRFLNEDGSLMTDDQVRDVLRASWETLSSGGANKLQPGQFRGDGARANRGGAHRELHFRDADAYIDYLREFGDGTMYDAISGHVARMARDITLVERYGPNPAHQMRVQLDLAEKADGGVKRSLGMEPESYWSVVSGAAQSAKHARLAQIAQGVRNVEVVGKLQGAMLSSITDLPSYFVSTGYNKLGYWNGLKNIALANTPAAKQFLNAHGLMADTLITDMNRWAGDHMRHGITSRLAHSTMKASLLNAWTNGLRRAFSLTMMQGITRMAAKDWGGLSEFDRFRLEANGITEADWSLIRTAAPDKLRGVDIITPEAIWNTHGPDAQQAATKLLAFVLNEAETAIINPDLATRVMTSGAGLQRGTVRGELARSVMQFKSFPIAMISRHWGRILETPAGMEGAPMIANPVAYAAALTVSLTALGAIAYQTKQLVSGKDPVDMTGEHAVKFWLRAFVQGGGAGILGDLLLTDPSESPGGMTSGALKNLAGPAIGAAGELAFEVGLTNIWQAARDKPTHAGAELVRWLRSHTPYVNLWYAKAALDHAGLHALQENLSPGYLAKMRKRAQRNWGQDHWWEPGGLGAGTDFGPQRAPDIAGAVGE